MRGKFILVVLFTIIIGVQPALAQSKNEAPAKPPAKPAAQEKPVKDKETVININLASDKDFKQALEAAGEVELVSEDHSATNATNATNANTNAKSDNSKNQGKASDKK